MAHTCLLLGPGTSSSGSMLGCGRGPGGPEGGAGGIDAWNYQEFQLLLISVTMFTLTLQQASAASQNGHNNNSKAKPLHSGMQQRSSTDEKWVSYVVIVLVYTIGVVTDWISALIFLMLLLQFSGLLPRRLMFALVELILIADLLLKSPYIGLNTSKFLLDDSCVRLVLSWQVKPQIFVYLVIHAYNLYLCFYYCIKRNKVVHIKQWGPLMTQIMVYTQPILMYGLSLFTYYWPFRVVWAVLACLQVLDIFPVFNHITCCLLITSYFFVPSIDPQYVIKIGHNTVPKSTANNIIISTFIVMLILLNVYSNPHPDYKQHARPEQQHQHPDGLSASGTKKVVARRQLQDEESKMKIKSIVVLLCAIGVCLITSSLGNIFILFGIYFSIPEFKAKRFFFFLGLGIIISLILDPDQIAYFLYLYIVVLVLGQQITSTQLIQYETHSYSFFLDFYRLYIMLSHVSFLNWLIAIFRSSTIVTLALSVRIFCRYFNYVSVFLGTNDDYGVGGNWLHLHAISDLVLIVYLVLLCLYSPKKTKTYAGSTVTNILLEYPLLQKCRRVLTIFRSFNWISYIAFSLIILSRKPSLYILIHIFYLLLILICDTMKLKSQEHQQKLLKVLWSINFYVTIIMIFTRYFYFLKQYDSNSDLMDYLLSILTKYRYWIGLDQLTKETEGLGLLRYFLYDAAVLVLSWINLYVYQFKVYYQGRTERLSALEYRQDRKQSQRVIEQISSPLIEQKIEDRYKSQIQQGLDQQQIKMAKYENIHYFYHRFIKPVDMTAYLAQHEYKIMEKVLRDCLLDFCFSVIVLAFYLEKETVNYVFYFPHFVISAYSYYIRFTKGPTAQFTQKILGMCTAYSFVILFSSYVYITFQQMYNEDIPTALAKVYITYILCIIICFMYKLCGCLPVRLREESKKYHCIIYLCFPFAVQSQKLWTEILSIFSQFWLAFTMSLFFTNIFSPKLISTLLHPFIVIYLLVRKIGKQKSQSWLYIVCLISILDIWNYDFFGYFTILAVTVFYAVKTAQKLSQQEIEGSYRDEISETQSEVDFFPEEEKPQPDCEEKKWPYYMAYCTLIWMLPQIISLLWMFGVVWLSPSIIATLLIAFSYGNLLFQLLAQKQTKISQPLLIITLGITVLFFCYQIFMYFYCFLVPGMTPYDHSEMGLFLIFDSCFFYLILKKRGPWYIKRGNDAKLYWKEKTELVGQLGSQLHNEKKLITLEKYFSSKQRLTQKVNKISSHLKQNARKAYFQSLDSMLKTKDQQQNSYELYTNMLIFLDMYMLKKCFIMLNQYITNPRQGNIVEKAQTMRREIYRIYSRSFVESFSRYQNQVQSTMLEEEKPKQLRDATQRSSTINLQRVNQINQRYKKCFQIISKSTQRFNRPIRFIIQHLQIISMMVVIGWNLFGGVYTIPTNILIFGWAIVLENKTTIVFWLIVMSYSCLILVMKQVIVYLPSIFIVDFVFYYHPDDYLYEYLLVLVSVVQITLIKLGGTRYKTYSERESIYDAFYRAALNKAANGSELDKQQEFMDIYKNLAQPQKHSFWYRVFSKSRFKPGKDFYPLMSGIQLVILLYIFFFYDMMELESKKNRKSIGQLLTVSQFSSHMVIALFLQVMTMILDRFIISLNFVDQDNQILENFFLSFTFSVTEVKQLPPNKLDKVGIFDFLLVLKYLFHLSLLILINFFVYFYIPSAGLTKSLIPSCTEAECNKSYTYLSIFLILYFAYFLVSGLQIKHGFNRNKCKNVLMQKFHWINYYTYKMFTAIPFAWEFKKICDWTVTATALPLFHWMKFEDINARIYESKCEAEMIKIKPLGTPWNKYFLGPFGFIVILLLAFSPFIVYSPVNPFAVKDAVIGARTDIYLRMDNRYDYKFFSTSHATVVEKNEENFELKLTNQNLFLIKMSKFPDQNFLISQPVVHKLSAQIRQAISNSTAHQFSFLLILNVIQQEGGQSRIEWANKPLTVGELQDLYGLLTLKSDSMVLGEFYSPFPGELLPEAIVINSPNGGEYFQVELDRNQDNSKEIYFYYLTSNKFKVGVGILTFYLTYILVISRLLRFYLTGTVRNILYEGCYMDSILVLCQAVREARIVENFLQEESFYFELVDIMRHPKAIKQITGDFLAFRKKYI